MDDALIQRIRQAAENQFPGTGIILAYAFGSRVDGTARPDSDLDVGYYLAENHADGRLSLFDEMVLADALSRAIGLEVDLRNLHGAPLDLRGRVLEQGVRIFCSDERMRVAIESTLLSRYHDYKAMFAEMHKTRLASFAPRS